jgi:hypothetical protein
MGAVAFALCALQGLAWAEHWTSLGKHPLGDMSFDRDSVAIHPASITFWARRMYYQPQESKISKMKFTEQRVLQELNCQKRTMSLARMVFFDAKGKPVGAYVDLKGGPKPIESSGFFAKEAKLLCPLAAKPAATETVKNAAAAQTAHKSAKTP